MNDKVVKNIIKNTVSKKNSANAVLAGFFLVPNGD